jgi:hypothetical protein
MFADISRSTGLLSEVVRLLDFSISVPTKHNDAILSVRSRRCQYASGDEDCYSGRHVPFGLKDAR